MFTYFFITFRVLVLFIFTGHGGFRAKLHSLGKDIDPLCPSCGLPETAEHVIVSCTAFDGIRARLLRQTGLYVLRENDLPQLVTEQNYPHFKDFVYGWKTALGPAHFNLGQRGPQPGAQAIWRRRSLTKKRKQNFVSLYIFENFCILYIKQGRHTHIHVICNPCKPV